MGRLLYMSWSFALDEQRIGSMSSSSSSAAAAAHPDDLIESGSMFDDILFGDDTDDAMPMPSAASFGFETGVAPQQVVVTQPDFGFEAGVAPQVVVTQPDFGMATLRQRNPAATQRPVPTPQPRPDAGASFILTSMNMANERYELFKDRTARVCGARLERCYRRLSELKRFFCCVGIAAIVLLAVVLSTSDETAYVEDSMRPQYARHGHDGVDLRRVSVELQCSDIRSGILRPLSNGGGGGGDELSLDRIKAMATYLVHEDDLPCVCAPALGAPRRYVLLNLGTDAGLVHGYNPHIDTQWDGTLDSGERLDVNEASLVRENQRMLFPERAESVDVVRQNVVRLRFQDDECRARSLVVRQEHAWCVQACEDLFMGRSVYDVQVVEDDKDGS